MNYYNEWDPGAASWLHELIKEGLIPYGYVDERSITEITPGDLEGFTQCHFFAGIGGWPLALQLAGVPATVPLWTGSPPCQPFSVAGKQLGSSDPRHLAPAFLELVAQRRPAVLFGEQVAAAIGKHWLDALLIELEEQGYTCGTAVLPAASVGAPHKRDRLFFGASLLVHANDKSFPPTGHDTGFAVSEWTGKVSGSMANTNDTRPQGRVRVSERADQQSAGASGMAGCMADADGRYSSTEKLQCILQHGQPPQNLSPMRGGAAGIGSGHNSSNAAYSHHSFWSDADWLGCRDGKFRPVEPGTFPLVDGFPNRVVALRGAGNAIVPQVAAEFLISFFGAINYAST